MAFNQEPGMSKIQLPGFSLRKNIINPAAGLGLTMFLCLIIVTSCSQVNAAGTSASIENDVHSMLEAGEFANALELALPIANNDLKAELLTEIAKAQQEAGDFKAALATLRQIPENTNTRSTRMNKSSRPSKSLAGGQGGGQAIQDLIELIQEVTGGPDTWSDEGDEEGSRIIEWSPSTVTGVMVDPGGVLQQSVQKEKGNRLASIYNQIRKADLNEDMAKTSNLRLVSLTRLEKLIAKKSC